MTTHARARRANQTVPATAEAAAARFKCEAYLCTMSGNTCRDQHIHAAEFKPENRDACIDCPAGAARAKLLGLGHSVFNRAPICQGTTAKGAPCANEATAGGLCHGCSGNAASRSLAATNARKSGWDQKRKAKGKTKAPVKSGGPPKKRPWMVRSGAPDAAHAAATTCKREGCDRETVPGTALAEYCRGCFKTATTTMNKICGRTSTIGDRAVWLAEHPAMVQFRRRVADVPDAVAASPVDLPVPDIHVAVSPEAVDAVLEVEVEVVEAVTGGDVDVEHTPAEATPESGTCATDDGIATVTFKINGLAFARLQWMTKFGIYGDDPNDVARAAVFGWLQGFVWSEP